MGGAPGRWGCEGAEVGLEAAPSAAWGQMLPPAKPPPPCPSRGGVRGGRRGAPVAWGGDQPARAALIPGCGACSVTSHSLSLSLPVSPSRGDAGLFSSLSLPGASLNVLCT